MSLFRLAVVLAMLATLSGCNEPKVTDEFSRADPASFLSVDTAKDANTTKVTADVLGTIMSDVQSLLQRNPSYAQITHSHGYSSPTGYSIQFDKTCASHAQFVAAVRAEIAKATSAPVVCSDEPKVE